MKSLVAVIVAVGALMLFSGGASAALIDNPDYASWAKQKPGAKLAYESSITMPGMTMTQEETHVLKSIAPDKVVIEVTMIMTMGGMKNEQTRTHEVPAKVEETQQGLPPEMKGTIKKTGTGMVKAAGQEYQCDIWEFTGEAQGSTATGKVWRSEKVPGGMVQSEINLTTPMGAGVIKQMLKAITP